MDVGMSTFVFISSPYTKWVIRRYPGSMVMANGSVLVVGGEGGSNGIPIPTLETLPTPAGGSTVVNLDFLLVRPVMNLTSRVTTYVLR